MSFSLIQQRMFLTPSLNKIFLLTVCVFTGIKEMTGLMDGQIQIYTIHQKVIVNISNKGGFVIPSLNYCQTPAQLDSTGRTITRRPSPEYTEGKCPRKLKSSLQPHRNTTRKKLQLTNNQFPRSGYIYYLCSITIFGLISAISSRMEMLVYSAKQILFFNLKFFFALQFLPWVGARTSPKLTLKRQKHAY